VPAQATMKRDGAGPVCERVGPLEQADRTLLQLDEGFDALLMTKCEEWDYERYRGK
jgi:hypothetical protein